MTMGQRRLKVAKLAGWETDGKYWWNLELDKTRPDNDDGIRTGVPDYLNDLNAMHEAEQVFHNNPVRSGIIPKYMYETHLLTLTRGEPVYATAAQRAEAFVLTMDKETYDA
jgi:hypothetical protein